MGELSYLDTFHLVALLGVNLVHLDCQLELASDLDSDLYKSRTNGFVSGPNAGK